ncbi:MAG: hypothetical protein AAF439_01070 [Pseudomonadota bacterium]
MADLTGKWRAEALCSGYPGDAFGLMNVRKAIERCVNLGRGILDTAKIRAGIGNIPNSVICVSFPIVCSASAATHPSVVLFLRNADVKQQIRPKSAANPDQKVSLVKFHTKMARRTGIAVGVTGTVVDF